MKSSSSTLQFFAKFIEDELGIVYRDANFYQLDTRLQEVAQQSGFSDSDSLYEHCKHNMDPKTKLMVLDIATNNETLFFRDPKVFEALEKEVLTRVKSNQHSVRPIRIWSAACSFGQEVYSIAMMIDKLKRTHGSFRYEILATDISTKALEAAKQGVYSQLQVQRGLPASMLIRYFEKSSPTSQSYRWAIKPELKANISFTKLNLLNPFGGIGPFDIVLCRNVLIYQTVERKQEIVNRIFEKLNPGGVFFMGAAESLIGINDMFDMVRTERVTYYKRPESLAAAS